MFVSYSVEQGNRRARVIQAAGEYRVEGFTRFTDEVWLKLAVFARTRPLENFQNAQHRADDYITTGA